MRTRKSQRHSRRLAPVPPYIAHVPVAYATDGVALPITATVTSQSPPLTVTLYYSGTGDLSYTGLEMTNSGGDEYLATIPGGEVLTPTLRYYIEASDTVSSAVDGPHEVVVTAWPALVDLDLKSGWNMVSSFVDPANS